jgi:hypothetical protein
VPRVRYDGRGRLCEFGYVLQHNQVVEMSDEEAATLAAHPHVQVTVLGTTTHRSAGGDEKHHEEEG